MGEDLEVSQVNLSKDWSPTAPTYLKNTCIHKYVKLPCRFKIAVFAFDTSVLIVRLFELTLNLQVICLRSENTTKSIQEA